MKACEVCGEGVAPSWASVVDGCGVSSVAVCRECREEIEAQRCRVCGETYAEGFEGAYIVFKPYAKVGTSKFDICRACREDLLTDRNDRQEAEVCN